MIVGLKDGQINSITFGNGILSEKEVYVPDFWSLNDIKKNLLFKEGYSNSINDNNFNDKIDLFNICKDNFFTTRPDDSVELFSL